MKIVITEQQNDRLMGLMKDFANQKTDAPEVSSAEPTEQGE